MSLNCEMDYCIYNKDFFCILSETQVNMLGMCEQCILISIPDDILRELKERHLEEINAGCK